MRCLYDAVILLMICATIGAGCGREEAESGPAGATPAGPAAVAPPRELSAEQRAAIERIEATGGEIEFGQDGVPARIDLASERVFADEELVQAALEFPELKGLRLAVSSVSEETLARLAGLAGLEELFLQDAPIDDSGLSALLRAMPELKRLTLRRLNRVTDESLDAVAACNELEVLALIEMNQLSGAGLARLAELSDLRSLDLRNCGGLRPEDFGRLAALDGLVEVKLGGPAVNDAIAEVIVALPSVRSIAVEDAQITPAFFEKLTVDESTAGRIEALRLARSYGVTDEALESLGMFANLETLALRDVPVTGAFLMKLSETGKGPLPWKTLIVTNGFLDDEAIKCLPELVPKLERLDLRGNPGVSEASREACEKLEHLKEFRIDG